MIKQISLKDLLFDKNATKDLTIPQMNALLEQLKALNAGYGASTKIQGTPAEFATAMGKRPLPIWKPAPHLTLLSEYLKDLECGSRSRLLVSMPPRHGKSELISFWYPIWVMLRNPRARIILASYESDFATFWSRRVRNFMKEYGKDLGVVLDESSTAADVWHTTEGGSMQAAGANGPMTGKGAEFLIIDDPIKNAEEAASEVMREKLWDWWQSTAFTRLQPTGVTVIVGTRWHQDDLIGRLERFSTTGEGLPWDVIKLPAIAGKNDILGRLEDAPLWPQMYDAKKLADIQKGMSPYIWSALYQQNPTPEEGGGVKRAWWKYYSIAPAEFDQMVQSWDLSFKDLKKSDFTVGQVWGRRGSEFFLLAQVRQRMDAPETVKAIRNMWRLYPKANGKLIEDRANGPAVKSMLEHEVPGIIPMKISSESKSARLSGVAPLIEARNVYLPDPSIANWVPAFIEECAAFPNGAADDQLDAMVQALGYMKHSAWTDYSEAWREAKEGPPPKSTEEFMRRDMSRFFKARTQAAARRENDKANRTFGFGMNSPSARRMW